MLLYIVANSVVMKFPFETQFKNESQQVLSCYGQSYVSRLGAAQWSYKRTSCCNFGSQVTSFENGFVMIMNLYFQSTGYVSPGYKSNVFLMIYYYILV